MLNIILTIQTMKLQHSNPTNGNFFAFKCESGSPPPTDSFPLDSRLNIEHHTDSQQYDVLSQDEASVICNLPSKVYENCQRTARVIMLSELQKHIGKNKKLKQQLAKKLQQFLPQKKPDYQRQGQYTTKTSYFKSLHYSRVRIGQRNFINNILLNQAFKQKFQLIFDQKTYDDCDKARKNQNSQVSFEKRKKVIMTVIGDYKKKFYEEFSGHTKSEKVHEAVESDKVEQDKAQGEDTPQDRARMEEAPNQRICVLLLPIIPIPLSPLQYQFYRKSQNGCSQIFIFS